MGVRKAVSALGWTALTPPRNVQIWLDIARMG